MNQLDRVVQIGIGNRGFVFHVVVHRLVVDRIRRHEPDLVSGFLKNLRCICGWGASNKDVASDHRNELALSISVAVNVPLRSLN